VSAQEKGRPGADARPDRYPALAMMSSVQNAPTTMAPTNMNAAHTIAKWNGRAKLMGCASGSIYKANLNAITDNGEAKTSLHCDGSLQ
jgi:hypothetical protein